MKRDFFSSLFSFSGTHVFILLIYAVCLGTKEAVAKAKEDLEARIKELDNIIEDTMTVDPKHHKHFVARRGDVLRKIGDEFGGVVVSFPRAGVTSDRVNLKGARNCVDAAKARILDIVQDLEEQVTIDCEIPQQYHRYPRHIYLYFCKAVLTVLMFFLAQSCYCLAPN